VTGGFWVFGYGSLLWRTGFAYAQRRLAVLEGYRRNFCMESHHYRGTPEKPGLVLALEEAAGECCHGLAFQVAPGNGKEVLAYLRGRELISDAYLEVVRPVTLDDGARVEAVCYVMNLSHHQYRRGITAGEQIEMILQARGSAGPNTDYLFSTAETLLALGIEDAAIAELAREMRARLSS
jgi:cation transport protein ChaC